MILAIASLAALTTAQAAKQTPVTPPAAAQAAPCSKVEKRALDFWVGDWVLEWTNPDGSTGTGANRVTKDEFGECVIVEHFSSDDGSLKGMSVSTYFAPLRQWRQTWVDDQGGYFDLTGGPVSGETHVFALENMRPTESAPYLRMIWQDVTPASLTWRWQKRTGPGAPWMDSWVIRYRRLG